METSKEDFKISVSDFLQKASQHRKLLAHQFGTSFPTIDRWASGENMPTDLFADAVLDFIQKHVCDPACAMKERTESVVRKKRR